jgi:hypothetical protein
MIAGLAKLAARVAAWQSSSGPLVARTFHRLLGLIFLAAWWSLGAQVQVLIGSHGLMPIAPFLQQARDQLHFWQFPTLFWLRASDGVLTMGVLAGIALSLCMLAGYRQRLASALQVVLYLSYVTAARTFLSFQWDNLILECAFFGALLPTNRPARLAHTLFRLILFKLYWESGLAKWQSDLHDWRLGTAMQLYYETAPLPTWIAWYAHHLPAWWHRLESWATLLFELGVPLGIFGPRRARLVTFWVLTSFQLINAATANYGFFCYLAAVLHIFLLDEADLERARSWLRRGLRLPARAPRAAAPVTPHVRRRMVAVVAVAIFVTVSILDALPVFVELSPRTSELLLRPYELFAPWRVINSYHLFKAITTERIEPEVQTFDGVSWTAQDFHYKPGDPHRRPPFVAPHQPRVDFRLWFYGLAFQRPPPGFVIKLVDRVCHEPKAVQSLFAAPLPDEPQAVRLVFWQYHFTSAAERRRDGTWWKRQPLAETRPISCSSDFGDGVSDDD